MLFQINEHMVVSSALKESPFKYSMDKSVMYFIKEK